MLKTDESMDLSNDPRFAEDNVIDKRLTAFTTLSIISSLMSGTAVTECFELEKDMDLFHGSPGEIFRGWIQTIGFFTMTVVLFMNIACAMVFGTQFFFVTRLMTGGPLGFESARSFYMNKTMIYFRHRAAQSLIWGMPMFTMALGCMMYVKFDKEAGERDDGGFLAWLVFIIFLLGSLLVLFVGITHQCFFDSNYYTVHTKGANNVVHDLNAFGKEHDSVMGMMRTSAFGTKHSATS